MCIDTQHTRWKRCVYIDEIAAQKCQGVLPLVPLNAVLASIKSGNQQRLRFLKFWMFYSRCDELITDGSILNVIVPRLKPKFIFNSEKFKVQGLNEMLRCFIDKYTQAKR